MGSRRVACPIDAPLHVHDGYNVLGRRLHQGHIAKLVESVAKLRQLFCGDEAQATTAFLIMVVAKCADQLHLQVANASLLFSLLGVLCEALRSHF